MSSKKNGSSESPSIQPDLSQRRRSSLPISRKKSAQIAPKALKVIFHRNGCTQTDTRQIVINRKLSYSALLDQLSGLYHIPARFVFDARTGHKVSSLDQFEDGASYAVSDSAKFLSVPYSSVKSSPVISKKSQLSKESTKHDRPFSSVGSSESMRKSSLVENVFYNTAHHDDDGDDDDDDDLALHEKPPTSSMTEQNSGSSLQEDDRYDFDVDDKNTGDDAEDDDNDEARGNNRSHWHGFPLHALQFEGPLKDEESLAMKRVYGDVVISRVLVINTGGTIGMKNTPDGYAPCPGYIEQLARSLPMLHDPTFKAPDLLGPGMITPISSFQRRIYYEFVEYDPLLDSSNMDMSDWKKIANDIHRYYPHWDGFLILHGTDTMTYSASALSFMLENLGKSVILTGAQLPIGESFSDGLSNLLGALTIAGHCVIPEVCLFFNSKLFRGNRTSKITATGLDAFNSPNMQSLVEIGTKLVVRSDLFFKPNKIEPFKIWTKFNRHVGLLRMFPGISRETVASFLRPPMAGVVIQTYGAGNGPDRRADLLKLFADASRRGILIVNTSQCLHGNVSDSYRTGRMLRKAGVIPGHDMTPECALTKLAYVLGKTDLDLEQQKRLLETNIRGELTILGEEHSASLQDNRFVKSVAKALAASSTKEINHIRSALAPILLCSAARAGDVDWLKNLQKEGFDTNSADYDGRTALHLAAAEGSVESVTFLLRQGAHVHVKDRFGWTPLRDAIKAGSTEKVKLLVKAGAQLGIPPPELAAILNGLVYQRHVAELKLWIEADADISSSDYDGRTPVHVAAAYGYDDIIELLLTSESTDLTLVDAFGRTPFEVAVDSGFTQIAERLAEHIAGSFKTQSTQESSSLSSV